MQKIKKLDNRGFTLVELMVVIVIIAIIAAIAIGSFVKMLEDAHNSKATAEIRSLYSTGILLSNSYHYYNSNVLPTQENVILEAGVKGVIADNNVYINLKHRSDADFDSTIDIDDIYVVYLSNSGSWILNTNGLITITNKNEITTIEEAKTKARSFF